MLGSQATHWSTLPQLYKKKNHIYVCVCVCTFFFFFKKWKKINLQTKTLQLPSSWSSPIPISVWDQGQTAISHLLLQPPPPQRSWQILRWQMSSSWPLSLLSAARRGGCLLPPPPKSLWHFPVPLSGWRKDGEPQTLILHYSDPNLSFWSEHLEAKGPLSNQDLTSSLHPWLGWRRYGLSCLGKE